jgi:hypothetical protein
MNHPDNSTSSNILRKSLQIGLNEEIASTNVVNKPTLHHLPDEKLKSSSYARQRCPPRWRKDRSHPTTTRTKSFNEVIMPTKCWHPRTAGARRDDKVSQSTRQQANSSFHMTISSISSFGSITSDYESGETDDNDNGYSELDPSFRSVRSVDRWDMASQDSLPPSPFRRIFELPKAAAATLKTRTRSASLGGATDTMPRMPRRGAQ